MDNLRTFSGAVRLTREVYLFSYTFMLWYYQCDSKTKCSRTKHRRNQVNSLELKKDSFKADLVKRIKTILLCHFVVGTAHLSLAYVIPGKKNRLFEAVIFYLALVLSARRYIMFGNDFYYIHSKKFHRMSKLLRYENIPCFQYLLVFMDITVLLYGMLLFFIDSKLQMRDQEMLMFYAYVLIPVIILFVIYTAMEEKVVYKEILDPSVDIIEKFIPLIHPGENPNFTNASFS